MISFQPNWMAQPSPYPILPDSKVKEILTDFDEGTYIIYHPAHQISGYLKVAFVANEQFKAVPIYWNPASQQYQLRGKTINYEAPFIEKLLGLFPQTFRLDHRAVLQAIHTSFYFFGPLKAFEVEVFMQKAAHFERLIYFDTDVHTYMWVCKTEDGSIQFVPFKIGAEGLFIRDKKYSSLDELLNHFEIQNNPPSQKEPLPSTNYNSFKSKNSIFFRD